MSDKVYLGPNAAELDYGDTLTRISRVNLAVDSDHIYTSGDDTGRTLEVDCPWGSQGMADSILAKVSAVDYKPYKAGDALLDPAAEIGDGVTVGGVYSQISTSSIEFDRMCVSDISAPASDEIDDEYPYESSAQRAIERKLAYTRSLITKTAEEIRLEIENIDGVVSSLSLTIDGVTITGESGQTMIKGSSIDTSSIQANSITADKLNLSGAITFGDLSADVANDINDAHILASDASTKAASASSKVDAWSYGSTTYIDGNKIMAGTVMASQLLGGSVSLLTSAQYTAGTLGITGASSADYAIDLTSNGSLRLTASQGAVYLDSSSTGSYILLGTRPGFATGLHVNGHVVPFSDSSYYCGSSALPWAGIYSATSVVVTSDRNQKHDIEPLPDKYIDMLMQLIPSRYKINSGTSGRYHVGFIAQEVEEAMNSAGIDAQEFGGFVKDKAEDGSDIYMLRYEEFIGILTAKIKQLEARLNALEGV